MVMVAGQAHSESREAAADLAGLLTDYRTYQADFIQILVNEGGDKVQETTGWLKAKRPGLFYWEQKPPMTQFIVSNGEKVTVYDPDLEQVTIHSLDDRISTTPALLLSGEVDHLAETYTVTRQASDGEQQVFVLEPKSQDSLFISLQLRFTDGVLNEMRLNDSLSQLSILSFDDIELNESVPDSAFVLEYPDSVDVIQDGA
jgi:outer membrane lipoprotein carrier protein